MSDGLPNETRPKTEGLRAQINGLAKEVNAVSGLNKVGIKAARLPAEQKQRILDTILGTA